MELSRLVDAGAVLALKIRSHEPQDSKTLSHEKLLDAPSQSPWWALSKPLNPETPKTLNLRALRRSSLIRQATFGFRA